MSKTEKIIVAITILTLIIGFSYKISEERKSEKLFENSTCENAIVEEYSTNMGTTYINYKYKNNGKWYEGRHPAGEIIESKIPVGTPDLKIKYALEAPYRSIIIDERFNEF